MKTPTVMQPYRLRRIPDYVTRVYIDVNDHEVNLVDPDTGLVIYTTPADDRAEFRADRYAKNHVLSVVPKPEAV